MSKTENQVWQTARAGEWWLPKAGNILAVILLIAAATELFFWDALGYLLPATATILGIGACGHIVNDWLDIPSDAKSGKRNRMAGLAMPLRFGVLLLFLSVALVPWYFLPWDRCSLLLLLAEFALLLLYAVPPVRLKERSLLGVLADGLYAYAIPSVLAAYTFFLLGFWPPDFLLLGLLFVWQWMFGIHQILIHQVVDYENDQAAGDRTFVVAVGVPRAIYLTTKVVLEWELVWFFFLLVYLSRVYLPWYFLLPIVFLVIKFGSLFYGASQELFARLDNERDMQMLNVKYYRWLIVWNLFYCSLVQPWYLSLFGVLLLVNILTTKNIRDHILFKLLSEIGNLLIFYFRIYLKKEDEKTALREHYDQSVFGKPGKQKSQLPSIAIINKNKQKYTETFVAKHLRELPFDVHFFYGEEGYLPKYGIRGNILSNNSFILKCFRFSCFWLGLPEDYYYKKAFQEELLQREIQVVLAEFGTVAAPIAPLCHDLKIPLVAIFYGYDGFHQKVLEDNKAAYQSLFQTATALVGVSRDMLRQLSLLDAPEDKLHYLPCGVNLGQFKYSDHSGNPPICLAVGRLTETKSPHLTIMAFNEVLKKIPTAKLTIVGDGELREACVILAKALGIAEHVTFKGILSHDAVYEEMKQASVFVQHSITTPIYGDKEGTPVAVMEAMACGLPVVSTRHAGIAEMIIDGETGLLVEEFDFKQMADNITLLLLDKEKAKIIGKKANVQIRDNSLLMFNTKSMANLIKSCV